MAWVGELVMLSGKAIFTVSKVECVVPMVIWSEFRIWKYRDENHREDAPHFTWQPWNFVLNRYFSTTRICFCQKPRSCFLKLSSFQEYWITGCIRICKYYFNCWENLYLLGDTHCWYHWIYSLWNNSRKALSNPWWKGRAKKPRFQMQFNSCVLFCFLEDKRVFFGLFDQKMKSNTQTHTQTRQKIGRNC